jgi:hypothetical protein
MDMNASLLTESENDLSAAFSCYAWGLIGVIFLIYPREGNEYRSFDGASSSVFFDFLVGMV